jgi:hypothetical protein
MNRLVTGAAVLLLGIGGLAIGPAVTADAASGGYAMVKGTIIKESGNPLANTTITVGIGDCENPGGCGTDSVVTVRTDAGGHYHARVLVTINPNVTVSVPAKGPYLSRSSAPIKIAAGKTFTKNLTVYKESMIVGKVVDANGAPISAIVRAYRASDNYLSGGDLTVGKRGGYFHLSLRGGSYKLKLYYNTDGANAVVTSWYGSTTKAAATVVTVAPGATVRARVVFTR